MSTSKPGDINLLVGQFMGLYEEWEDQPSRFDWAALQSLAGDGAQAYNEGYGPSFQVLAFDGYPHGEFHERFLTYLLQAGFDPFHTVVAASGQSPIPVFGHDGLADAAKGNPVSARMLATLQALARQRFGGDQPDVDGEALQRIVLLCHESIPDDVLAKIAPGFVSSAAL